MLSDCRHITVLFKLKSIVKKQLDGIVRIFGWGDCQVFPPVCVPCNAFTAEGSDLNKNIDRTD